MKENDTPEVNVTDLINNPFQDMKISENWKAMSLVKGRTPCPKCQKSRKYFCYSCYVPVKEITDIIPKVKVGVEVYVPYEVLTFLICKYYGTGISLG